MRFGNHTANTARCAAFTLAEVLAALVLMAIVIPVAVQALRIASLAGEVANRKAIAARVGERVLEEAVVTHQWNLGTQNGVEQSGPYEFRWTMHNDAWDQSTAAPMATTANLINSSAIHQFSIDVTFAAQGKDYLVQLSTLIDTSQ